jgi:hypoxanthine phosphoribosyltransferase
MEHLYCEWPDYDRLCEHLALQVYRSGWEFDEIVCLARGGMRVGDVLSRIFRKPLGVLFTSSYREQGGTEQGALRIGEQIAATAALKGPRLLLVDDLVDTGSTFVALLPLFKSRYPQFTEVRTAVLWQKAGSQFHPDYVAERLLGDPWVHQPFEKYDRTLPTDLPRSDRPGSD